MRELPWRGKINLRGAAPEFFKAARAALGLELPRAANTVAAGGGLLAFWLGPDEWLGDLDTPPARKIMQKPPGRPAAN